MQALTNLRELKQTAVHRPARSSRPVRVCFLIDELIAAGTEGQLLALISRLDRNRVKPTLCLLRGGSPLSQALEPTCCPVVRLGIRSFRHPSTPLRMARLYHLLRRGQFDVLQVYFADSTYMGVLVGTLARVPRIVRTRNNLGYWMKPRDRWLGRLATRFSDALISNCDACQAAFLRDEGKLPPKSVVLENGVDLERFPLPRFERRSGREPRVGIVANLRPVKNLELFVRAAARVAAEFPTATFHIAGEGELRPQLRQLASDLGIGKRFFLPGSVANIPAFLSQLDAAVLCSHSEGMSNALLEYMAAGVPIVANDVGANRQLLAEGACGMLIPPNEEVALAGAVSHLLRDPERALRLARAARRRVEQQYRREVMVERFQAFYEDLVDDLPRDDR